MPNGAVMAAGQARWDINTPFSMHGRSRSANQPRLNRVEHCARAMAEISSSSRYQMMGSLDCLKC